MDMTSVMTHRINLSQVPNCIRAKLNFNCNGTLRGTRTFLGYGQLPAEHQDKLARQYDAEDFYGVLSYETPIAWFADGEWTVPDVKYSPTTSRHQTQVRRGIA